MLAYLARYWLLLVVRGAATVLCGLPALLWPGATIAALVVLFGASALVDGVLEPTLAFRRGSPSRRTAGRWPCKACSVSPPRDRQRWFLARAISVFGIYVLANPGRGALRSCG